MIPYLKLKTKSLIKLILNEYYSVRNVFFSKDWFFKDLGGLIKNVGNYHNIFRPVFYDHWVDNFSNYKGEMERKILKITKYCNKKDIFLIDHDLGKF